MKNVILENQFWNIILIIIYPAFASGVSIKLQQELNQNWRSMAISLLSVQLFIWIPLYLAYTVFTGIQDNFRFNARFPSPPPNN